MAVTIAVLGGGSAYAPGLVHAFLRHADVFAGAELTLMDIAERELATVHRLAERMAAGSGLRVRATTDRERAIEGADYVLTTFRQGGFAARHLDEAVPLEHGLVGQETIGPGGFFFAQRSLPEIRAVIDAMRRLAPGAVLVNYTNPTQIVAEAVARYGGVPCIAICDQTDDDRTKIAHALGVDPGSVELTSAGLNHATWSTRCSVEGEDGVARMIERCDAVLERPDVADRVKRQFRLTRAYGRVPNSYLQYYYYREETLAEARAAPRTRAQEIQASLPGYYRHFEEQAARPAPRLERVRGGSLFGDMAVEVLRALVTGADEVHTLNVRNGGALPDFASERIVEVPTRMRGGTLEPVPQRPFPPEVVGLLRMLAEYQRVAAEAIWQGDPDAMTRALAANPLVLSLPLAQRLLRARHEAGRRAAAN